MLLEDCKKLLNLMDSFWFDIKYEEVDAICLLKIKIYREELVKT